MNKIYNTAIIGGGASGLISGVELTHGKNALNGQDVIILERNDRVGKKLIATGNGQGNLTNANLSSEFFYGDKAFIDAFLCYADKINLPTYLEQFGIPLCFDNQGRAYPLSKQASAVLDAIRAYLLDKGVKEQTGVMVESVEKVNGYFTINSDKGQYFAKHVILATGGNAGKQFGTDGKGYAIAEKLGHKKTALYPSLVQLKTQTENIRALKGLKENARVTCYADGKKVKSAVGDLLFTDYGVSGNTVFNVSSGIADSKNAYLIIEFLPDLTFDRVCEIIENRKKLKYIEKNDLLSGVLNKRVGQAVLKTAKSDSVKDIAYAIKNFRLAVTGTTGFNYAQVTRGGIKTDQIDKNTYQSKLIKDLYLTGEILDVDGDCGGYNLTFAFISGIVAAKSVKGDL